MKKWRRCPEVWWDGSQGTPCQLPDNEHTIHTYCEVTDDTLVKIQWCDKKYEELL